MDKYTVLAGPTHAAARLNNSRLSSLLSRTQMEQMAGWVRAVIPSYFRDVIRQASETGKPVASLLPFLE